MSFMRKTFFFSYLFKHFKKQADVMRYEDKIKIKQQRKHLAIISLQTIFKKIYQQKRYKLSPTIHGVYRL